MKRLFVLAFVAGGALFWWRRRSHGADAEWAPSNTIDEQPQPSPEPPKLGGDVDPELLAILACPVDKAPVSRQGNYLVCQECQRHYPIRDGIPVMLIDEATIEDEPSPEA
jgi:uncharacterized protein